MVPREYYIDGDKRLSEKAILTGRELMQRSRFPVRGKVLMQLGHHDIPDKVIAESDVVKLPTAPVYFITAPRPQEVNAG